MDSGSPGHETVPPPERDPWVPPPDLSFGARIAAPDVDVPTRQVGQACSSWGPGDCKGGICLQVSPLPNPLEICTQPCEGPDDCPKAWRCASVRPGGKTLCTPPPDLARRLHKDSVGGAP